MLEIAGKAKVFAVMQMTRALKILPFVFAALASARADIAYDVPVVPGYFNGTGNTDCCFTELTANYSGSTLNLAVGVVLRYEGTVTPDSTNDYSVPDGNAPSPHSGSAWGFPFSIATSGALVLDDFTYLITITDTTRSTSVSFDPASLPDNVYCALSLASCNSGTVTSHEDLTVDTLLQNSEAPSFPFLATPLNYNSGSPDTYVIALSATPNQGAVQTVSEDIDVLPEPAAQGLAFAGLLALLFAARKRR